MKEPLFIIWGKVINGQKRGKSLGYPTANIRLHKKIPEGIYAATVRIDNKEYISATFVGASTTFGETEKKVEPFIINFSGNLYSKWIRIKLFKKIRENQKFSSEASLSSQMKKDVQEVLHFFT